LTRASEPSPRTAGEMLQRGREFLARRELPDARLEAELLVAHALGLDRLGLFLQLDRPVQEAEISLARELLLRRSKREPVAYLTGRREFYGRVFEVDRSVLIPRAETELLVDLARERAKVRTGREPLALGDVGTGSGCLAVTLALELPGSAVVATDLSPEALECARRNAERLEARVSFALGDGPRALTTPAGTPRAFDVIVSNPPYIALEERAELAPEVREFEPALALFAPAGDPHRGVRQALDDAVPLLAPGGVLLVELGHSQAAAALELARKRNLRARTHRDLARIERVLEVSRDAGSTAIDSRWN
jgi:release factor glutamine methyltransferase